ncbi:hypothetical protein Tco_0552714, partial [Tanacetum coccineum]
MMSFLTAIVISRYHTTNNQLRTSSNTRQQATIYDGKVTMQPVQGSVAASSSSKWSSFNRGRNSIFGRSMGLPDFQTSQT